MNVSPKLLTKFSIHHVSHTTVKSWKSKELRFCTYRGKPFILRGKHKQACYRTTDTGCRHTDCLVLFL